MKLSELKPCAGCKGPLLKPGIGCWYVVKVSTAMINPAAARDVVGLNTMFGGDALGLAEVMAPRAEEAVVIMGDRKDGGGWAELHLCIDCYCELGNLPGLVELKDKEPVNGKHPDRE